MPANAVSIDCIPGSIQSSLANLGLQQYDHAVSLWVFFAACGVTELAISFSVCTPLERFWPFTSWPKRNSIAADVTYAFFVRIVLFPLIAFFEFNWLHRQLWMDFCMPTPLPSVASCVNPCILASWPAVVFIANFCHSRSRRLLASSCLTGMAGGMGFTLCIMLKIS